MNQILDNPSFETAEAQTAARQFFAKVYMYMFLALIISGAIAFQYGNQGFVTEYFLNETGTKPSMLFYVVIFAPIGVGLLMQTMVNRISFPVLFMLFALYSTLLGFSLTTIFVFYKIGSIASTFLVAAGVFAVMAIMGYVTKADLTRFGSLLYMVFFGMIIAGLINFFMHSETLSYIMSIIGVFVFTGLTAYHMQQLKVFAMTAQTDEETKNKMALLGGFTLYVLFINLFLTLLRLFGERE
jgi:FtsH-binding integral membrane protein